MALPDVTLTVQDGGLGIVPVVPTTSQIKIGVCSAGVVGTLYSFSDQTTMQSTLGYGPLVESVARTLADAGGPVYCMPINPSQFGFAGTVTQVGTGTGTVTASMVPTATILLTITTGGAVGTFQFTFKVGNGATSQPQVSAATFTVPGTLTVISFPAGTYVLNDTYTFNTDGTTGHTGTGTPVPTQQSSPADVYQTIVTITVSGALGAGVFTYSLDNGVTTSQAVLIPSSGKYQIPQNASINTGVLITFAGTFNATDTYSFNTAPAGYNNTDVTNAFTTLMGLSTTWFMAHVVGQANTSAGAASLAATVDTQMTTFATNFRYAFGLIEAPTLGSIVISGSAAIVDVADTDTVLKAAFASFVSVRTAVGAGDCQMTSPLTGRQQRRNMAWTLAGRLSAINPGKDAAEVKLGSQPGVQKLFRDEGATPALDVAFFCTLRTFPGRSGFFITSSQTFAGATSDFKYTANRRVMDVACAVTRNGFLSYLNSSIRVSASTGFIAEQDARSIEGDINSQLKAALVETTPPNASASTVQLSRTSNILATQTEPATVRVTPLGYTRFIPVNIGFVNPALAS